jgi:hypothetical protein
MHTTATAGSQRLLVVVGALAMHSAAALASKDSSLTGIAAVNTDELLLPACASRCARASMMRHQTLLLIAGFASPLATAMSMASNIL